MLENTPNIFLHVHLILNKCRYAPGIYINNDYHNNSNNRLLIILENKNKPILPFTAVQQERLLGEVCGCSSVITGHFLPL